MNQTNFQLLKQAIIYLIIFSMFAIISILWIDKPSAYFFAKYTMHWHWLHLISENFCPTAMCITMISIFIYHRKQIIQGILTAIYFYATLYTTMLIKSEMKYVFGRYWPNTWKDNNPSLLHDGAYGFQWFHAFGEATSSFPSGHSTWVAFCVVWLCYYFPQYKYLWMTFIPIIAITLMLQNFHYLGDCLAVCGLGIFLALLSIIIWRQSVKTYQKAITHG